MIFVDTSIKDINDTYIYVLNINGEIYIKYVKKEKEYYYIKSINQDYEDIKVKELVVIGKVTGVFNRI